MNDYEKFKKYIDSKESTRPRIPVPGKILPIGKKDKLGNLMILGGREVDIVRTTSGRYLVGLNVYLGEEEAVQAYNSLNGTRLQLDYISTYFQPWFEKQILKTSKNRFIVSVESKSDPDKSYDVHYDQNGNLICECPGFRYRGSCWHTEAVKEMLEEQEKK